MWPFRTLDDKIADIEDKLVDKKTRLGMWQSIGGNQCGNTYAILERINLAADIAVLDNKLARLKSKQCRLPTNDY